MWLESWKHALVNLDHVRVIDEGGDPEGSDRGIYAFLHDDASVDSRISLSDCWFCIVDTAYIKDKGGIQNL
jgi:hypothetical protein